GWPAGHPLAAASSESEPAQSLEGLCVDRAGHGEQGSRNANAFGWIERQMKKGRVILMLDGLDETEPDLRDRHVLPWLQELCRRYPTCRYLVSSRPVGYP